MKKWRCEGVKKRIWNREAGILKPASGTTDNDFPVKIIHEGLIDGA